MSLNDALYIDTSDAERKLQRLTRKLSEKQMNAIIWDVCKRSGTKVKKILQEEIPKDYSPTAAHSWIGSAVGSPIMGGGGASISCVIPLRGTKGTIGKRFRANGSKRGWASLHGKPYKVNAKIVTAGQSTLPMAMKSYGTNQKPFRNSAAKSLNGIAWVRQGKARLPIIPIVGLAVPQMAANRSEEKIGKGVIETMEKRLDHYVDWLLSD